LNLPLQLVAAPTKRAKDGLALSSRNAYLSEKERAIAPDLYKALTGLADELASGGDVAAATAKTEAALLASGFTKIDYIAVRDAESFAAQARAVPGQSRLLAAAWLGSTRLIDNVPIG
ncbi:MAG: pantoate--beta-alanine ligase, partial [Hyphomicrobium sp.]